MALTLRTIKNSALTHQELDDNFTFLKGLIGSYMIFADGEPTGVPAVTGETVLSTYTATQGVMDEWDIDDIIEVEAYGEATISNPSGVITVYMGNSAIHELNITQQFRYWHILIRVSKQDGYQTVVTEAHNNRISTNTASTLDSDIITTTEDLTAPIIFKLTANNNVASANDFVKALFTVKLIKVITL